MVDGTSFGSMDTHTGAGSQRRGPFALLSSRRMFVVYALLALVLITAVAWFVGDRLQRQGSAQGGIVRLNDQTIPLKDAASAGDIAIATTQNLSVNGQLHANNTLILAPTQQPSSRTTGQLYLDSTTSRLNYFDGSRFLELTDSGQLEKLASQADVQTLSSQVNGLQNQVSQFTLLADIARLSGANSFTASNAFSGGVTANTLTVSGNTTLGPTTISSLVLSNPLSVASGGTGRSSLTANGVLVGNGTSPLTSVTAATSGYCLISTLGAPSFQACPGGSGGVTSLDGLSGAVTIADSTAAGSVVTINNASTTSKGIAQFNANNFSVSSGTVNTAQDITITATPTFAGATLNGNLSIGANSIVTSGATISASELNVLDNGIDESEVAGVITDVTAGSGLTGGAASGNATLNVVSANGGIVVNADNIALTLQPTGDALSTTTSSGSGLEILSGGLTLLQGCGDAQILKWNEASDTWQCAADAGGTGVGDDVTVNGADAAGVNLIDTTASGTTAGITWNLNTVSNPDDISLTVSNASTTQAGVVTTGVQSFSGDKTFNNAATITGLFTANGGVTLGAGQTLSVNGDAITDLTGTGLFVSGGALQTTLGTSIDSSEITDGTIAETDLNISNAETSGYVLSSDGLGGFTWVPQTTDTNTTYSAGNGLTLTGTTFDVGAGSCITVNTDDIGVTDNCVNAATLGGNNAAFFQNASNINAGTLSDARLSGNVAKYNDATPAFTNVITQGGNTVCDTSGNCAGAGNGGGVTNAGSQNYLTKTDSSGNLVGSLIYDDGTAIGIGTNLPSYLLDIQGGSGIVAQFSGRVIGADAVNSDEFVTKSQLDAAAAAAAGSGVTSLNALVGDLTIQGSSQINVSAVDPNITLSITANSIGDAQLAFDTGQNLTTASTPTFSGLAINGDTITDFTGTGLVVSAGALQTTLGTSIDSSEIIDGTITGTDIANDTIALGTKTTGNYVSGATAGTGIAVTGSAGEGWSPTISFDYSSTLASNSLGINQSSFASTGILFEGTTADGFETLLTVADPTADNTITLPNASGTVCLTTGNCAGAGSGVTTSGGTTNVLAKFTAGQAIGDSSITDDGSTVTTSVNLIVQGGNVTAGTGSQLGSFVLNDGNGQTTTLRAGDSASNLTFILPTSAGSQFQCLKYDTAGQLIWDNCDGGSGGGSGVTSLNTLSGALAIQGSAQIGVSATSPNISLSITANSIGDAQLAFDTGQNLTTTSTPTFGGLNLGGNLSIGTNSIVTGATTISSTELDVLDGGVDESEVAGVITDVTAGNGLTGGAASGNATLNIGAGSCITVNADDIGVTDNCVNAATLGGNAAAFYQNATNLTTGTLSDTRLSGNVAKYNDVTANFTGTLQQGGNTVCDASNNCGYATSSGSGNYIQNQNASAQAADFYINGNGTANTFTSTVATGTAPLTVASTTVVSNFNADLLDGQQGSFYQDASNLNAGTLSSARISGAYNGLTGSTALATVGTITSGTWQGGTVGVPYGGTGATTFAANGVLYGNGTSAVQATAAGTTGQCLLATTDSAPSWGACTGSGGVSSIQGGTGGSAISGALTLSNSTTSGSTITLDTATAAVKGIASFSSSNFSVTAGAVSIKPGGVGSTEIADGTITGTDIANDAVALGTQTTGNYVASVTTAANSGLAVTGSAGEGWNPQVALDYTATLAGNPALAANQTTFASTGLIFEGSSADTNELLLTVTNPTADRTITLPNASGTVCLDSGNCLGGSGGASNSAAYLTVGNDATLTGERAITAGTNLSSTDGGANGAFTLNVVNNPTFSGQITSTVTTGTAPLVVASTTLVANLNADLLDGQQGSFYQNASNINAGTLSDTRLSGNVAKYNDVTANFTGTLQQGGNNVCTTAGNCAGVGGIGDILQNGNSFGATMTIGTNDAQALQLETSGVTRVTISSTGDTTFTGSAAVQGSSVTVGTTSLQGSLVLNDGNSQTTTLRAGNSVGNLTYTLPSADGSANQCLKTSGTGVWSFSNCNNGSGGGGAITLQDAYDAGNTITTSDNRHIGFTLADTATDSNFLVNIATGSTGKFAIQNNASDLLRVTSASGVEILSGVTASGLATFNGNISLQTGDTITINGDAFTDLTGNGLQNSAGALSLLLDTGSGLSTSASGLSLLRTCANGEILKWNGSAWACATDGAGGGSGVDTVGAIDGGTYSDNGASIIGTTLYLQAATSTHTGLVTHSGTQTFGGDKTFAGNVVVAANQSLTVTGGATGTRPASPTEGMVYYDTTTKQLLTYANGKWQADRTSVTKTVAPSGAPQYIKDSADYVVSGNADDEINAALTAAAGGKVYLFEGTYVAGSTILVPNNTTLSGAGNGTVIELADLDAGENLIENSDTSTGTGVTIRDLKLDGRNDLNTAGTQYGIYFNGMGDTASGRPGSSITSVLVTRFRTAGINLTASNTNTITSSTVYSNGGIGIYVNSDWNTVMNNSVASNTTAGISFNGAAHGVVSSNSVALNGSSGISLTGTSSRVTVSGNTLGDNGGSTTNNAIFISNSDNNTITGNTITDTSCTTACHAINIFDATSDANYLDDNTLGSTGTINDAGTGTVYGGQVNSSGNFMIQPSGTIELLKNTNVTGTLNISSDVDTNGSLTVGNADQFVISNTGVVTSGTWQGTAVAGAYGGTGQTTTAVGDLLIGAAGNTWNKLAIGGNGTCLNSNGTTASWVTCGSNVTLQTAYDNSSSPASILLADAKNFVVNAADTTTDPSIIFNLQCSTCSASGGRFAVQDAGTDIFTINPNGDIIIGTASNNITLSAAGGYEPLLNGTARHTKKITLIPEYAGSVLDATSDSSCSSANNGTMVSAYDSTNRMNYYDWTSSQGTAQCYDVVVQVPIPADFNAWAASTPISIQMKKDSTGTGAYAIQVLDSTNTADTNYNYSSPGTLTTSWSNVATSSLASSNYTAGGYFTVKIRMQSTSSAHVSLGNLVLTYRSSY